MMYLFSCRNDFHFSPPPLSVPVGNPKIIEKFFFEKPLNNTSLDVEFYADSEFHIKIIKKNKV
jgi:hypothetical protein